jgi:4'-phosphopantetheinyl transferase
MIDWLTQSIAAVPGLDRGVAPEGLLGPEEQRRLASLTVAKRRCDWLIGRWTAKRLLQSYVARRTGAWLPLDAFTIASDPDGAPRIIANCKLQIPDCDPNLQSAICNLKLSISHCHGHGFCAISDQGGIAIGADIERVEPRAPEFAGDYFTTHELAQVAASPTADRDATVTLIWSAKEAALKALRFGLTVDTRRVSCALAHEHHASLSWEPLTVDCALGSARPAGRALHGWWRLTNEFAMTIVLAEAPSAPR